MTSKDSPIPNNQDKSDGRIRATIMRAELYSSSPLPPAEVLAEYEKLQPGAVDRLITMAEKEADNRHEIQKEVIKNSFHIERLGQIVGLTIFLVALIFGFVLILQDKPIMGMVSVIGSMVAVVSLFIYGRESEQHNSDTEKKPTRKHRS